MEKTFHYPTTQNSTGILSHLLGQAGQITYNTTLNCPTELPMDQIISSRSVS